MINELNFYVGKEMQDLEIYSETVVMIRGAIGQAGYPLIRRIFDSEDRSIRYQFHELNDFVTELEGLLLLLNKANVMSDLEQLKRLFVSARESNDTLDIFKD